MRDQVCKHKQGGSINRQLLKIGPYEIPYENFGGPYVRAYEAYERTKRMSMVPL